MNSPRALGLHLESAVYKLGRKIPFTSCPSGFCQSSRQACGKVCAILNFIVAVAVIMVMTEMKIIIVTIITGTLNLKALIAFRVLLNALVASFLAFNDPAKAQVITTVATSLKVHVILNQDSRVQERENFLTAQRRRLIQRSAHWIIPGRIGTILLGRAPEFPTLCCPHLPWVLS